MGRMADSQQAHQPVPVPNHHQSSTSISHFSHPHPLHLSINAQYGQSPCSGCKNEASGSIYTCTTCNYTLHEKCSKMPQKITHPYDANNHVLSLLTKPAYPEGIYYCDACGEKGNGFCYHCPTCGIDLHILCASLPLLLTHQAHQHPLSLTFSAPYPTGTFNCDLCRLNGSKTWLYRCSSCEFDVHLVCVKVGPPQAISHPPSLASSHVPPPQMANPGSYFPNQGQSYNAPAPGPGFSGYQARPQTVPNYQARPQTAPNYQARPQTVPNYQARPQTIPVGRPVGVQQNTMGNQIAGHVANGIASGVSQAVAQEMIQGMFGGGGGGNAGADGGAPAESDLYAVNDGGYSQMEGGYEGGEDEAHTSY